MRKIVVVTLALFAVLAAVIAGCSSSKEDQIRENLADATRLLSQKRMREADAAIDRAIQLDPARSASYDKALKLYSSRKLWDRAEKITKEFIARAESRRLDENLDTAAMAVLYAVLGHTRQENGKPRDAERSYRKAVDMDPDNPDLLNDLGYFYAEEGIKLNEALRLLTRAAKISPGNPGIMDSLGWAQYKLGRYGDAVQTLRKVVVLAPDEAELRYHLGATYVKLGRKSEARVELEKALVLDPNLMEPAKLLRNLQK